MASDIRFGEDSIDLQAFRVRLEAADFELNQPSRRRRANGTAAEGDFRRAMVHTDGDALVLNFENDYSGGMVLEGRIGGVRISGTTTMVEARASLLRTNAVSDLSEDTPFLDGVAHREQQARTEADAGPSVSSDGSTGPAPMDDSVLGRSPPEPVLRMLSLRDIDVGYAVLELAREVLRLRMRLAVLERT